ncbi:hypothetical protein HWV00_13440 [Moritella sp. 24]|uniref:hypothetical protein n=1 Tax=Moritella sp. 24 TaxID=2746230 RepID=UPI001BAA3AC6|nr:hypothetical protein [Moritella sp. 24]QUM77156.1 hypothetical protein HWV00_13440 [Moritella sp. 24]
MNRNTLKNIHKIAASLAFILIATFQVSTILADTFATERLIADVKSTILVFVPVLMLAMMATGISANKLYTGTMKGVFKTKQTRMKIAAINGIFVLLPAAVILARWSEQGQFDTLYWTVQGIEIITGLVNLTMIGLNIRDGIRLGRKAKKVYC